MARRASCLSLAVVLLSACGDGAPTDAGVDVPAPSDAPIFVDAPDAPAAPSAMCRPCRRDVDCGDGAFCTVFADGAWACVTACATDDDCADAALASTCTVEAEGLPLGCRPTSGSCVVSAPGSACGACSGTYDVCAEPEPGLGAYCTSRCATDADCPMGFRRCREIAGERLCVRDEAASPERCAALPEPPACGSGRSCAAGLSCVGVATPRCLPDAAAGCPEGSVRIDVDGGAVCVPHAGLDPLLDPALADCACDLDDGGLVDEMATLAGRSRCELMFPHALIDLFPAALAHDELRLSFTDRVHAYWLAPPRFAAGVADRLDRASPAARLRVLAQLGDLSADARTPSPGPATDALAALVTAAGSTPDTAAIAAALGGVTGARSDALAALFGAVADAVVVREDVLRTRSPVERRVLFDAPSALFLPGFTPSAPSRDLIGAMRGDVDVGRLAESAAAVLEAIDQVRAAFAADRSGLGAATFTTPIGSIVIGTADADTHAASAYLLLVEPGGDDTYLGPVGATASIDNGVSIALDLSGTDTYGYAEVGVADDVGPAGHARLPSDGAGRARAAGGYGPYSLSRASRQGAGRLGIGIVADLGAEGDSYRSLRMSQGYGALGVGVLLDAGGDDVYVGEAGMQGSAVAGLGLLIDAAGIDRYTTYHASQGFAYVRGVGALVDDAGDDVYFAHPSDVLYASAQSAASNSSFCQGVAFGRRDDAGGLYMSGGLGILRDRSGDDRYTCGVFGQATGYWYGTGLLLEGDGDDHYDGEWYVQGADAHFATAVLLDEAGNDVHNETGIRRATSVGTGHDFSSAWLIDRDGDDLYLAPNLSLGSGNAGGFGALADLGGTDTYDAPSSLTFGNASIETPGDEARRMSGTVGFFLERGGTDVYTRPMLAPVANDADWTQEMHPGESEHGVGIDRASGRVGAGLD